jgi:hypothetical protein
MEQDKKRLKREYARLVSKLQRVLRRFTPIDPSDEDSIRDEYEPLAPTLVSMLMRGCSREELFRAIESHRANHWSSVPANSELDWKITDSVQRAFNSKEEKQRTRPTEQSKPLFRLDLRKDWEDVFNHIKEQVRLFVQDAEAGRTTGKLVNHIECGFECSQAGWVMLYPDTRPDAYNDGHWTLFIDKYAMERSHWRKAAAANMRGVICIVDLNGKETLINKDSEIDLCESIGLMLKAALLEARDQGLLLGLPLAPTCRLGVENFDGHFGWPVNGATEEDSLATRPTRPT